MFFCYKMTIAYDGTHYHGWQIQNNKQTIQALIQNALRILLKKRVVLIGAGRTDAGVHALAQTAHFSTSIDCDLSKFRFSLNGLLPNDICIKSLEKVSKNFHARYNAKTKEYHYHITLDKPFTPFSRQYRYHCPYKLDIDLIKKASKQFVGTHDFSSFANRNSSAKTSVRTIKHLDIKQEQDGIRIECEANGFLYKMMRNIVGTLIDIGRKKLAIDELQAIFEKKNRIYAPSTAPAKGLFLVSVNYQ